MTSQSIFINSLKKLKTSEIASLVDIRLAEFSSFSSKTNNSWFGELCFCLLTANWKAMGAMALQKQIGIKGFLEYSESKLQKILQKAGHRFHPQRAERIVLARDHKEIKSELKGLSSFEAREFLVHHIKGIGYKESSHFLRNVGYTDLAILDRHIMFLLHEYSFIKIIPKTLTKTKYLEIELIFRNVAKKLDMTLAELDLYFWYFRNGNVLK